MEVKIFKKNRLLAWLGNMRRVSIPVIIGLVSLFVLVSLGIVSCEPISGGGADAWYYIYITGDTGRTVQISYLEREKIYGKTNDMNMDGSKPDYRGGKDNVPIIEDVVLPFFKEVHFHHGNVNTEDVFLEIFSQNDSTTRAVIFDDGLGIPNDSIHQCWDNVTCLFKDCYEYNPCQGITKDSALEYLKKSNYPCYLEFSQDDSRKRVKMDDYWIGNWEP
ncbi:MAG: hypothetical protein LBU62_05250 [Bacteroidales bacterium]|jgi:hypothetical protein|nr:hypothetical protein [Bacteroidales bacterium]